MTIKKYTSKNHNFNFKRFYEVKDNKILCEECPANKGTNKWQGVYKPILNNPVNTNWKDCEQIKVENVVISESPSNHETSIGVPTALTTGQKIYKYFTGKEKVKDGWLEELDEIIYRTNIVRCQADSGIKSYGAKKIDRVLDAWAYCKIHLEKELDKIIRTIDINTNLTIYIAPGEKFDNQAKQIKKTINKLVKKYRKNNITIKEEHHFRSK